jgi:DNA gyrase subunit A
MSLRFTATDTALRPMGRSTSGVTGMKFRSGDSLLSMSVVRAGQDPQVFVVFENGLAKRSPVDGYRQQGRGGLGIHVAKLSDKGGDVVGALIVDETDEVMVVTEKGNIVRSAVSGVRLTSRNTQGVMFASPRKGDSIVAVARNAETEAELEEIDGSDAASQTPVAPGDGVPSDVDTSDGSGAPETDSGGDE